MPPAPALISRAMRRRTRDALRQRCAPARLMPEGFSLPTLFSLSFQSRQPLRWLMPLRRHADDTPASRFIDCELSRRHFRRLQFSLIYLFRAHD
jgi:hypothetical protein